MTTDQVLPIIYRCMAKLNQQLPPDKMLEPAPGTVLLGDGGKLDSLGLINLLVMLEEEANEALGLSLSLVDEGRMADVSGPYRSVASLAQWMSAEGRG